MAASALFTAAVMVWRRTTSRRASGIEKAADKGDATAMNNLGVLYDNGQGVAQDYAKAREWY